MFENNTEPSDASWFPAKFLLHARNVSDTVIVVAPHWPTTTRGQKTFRLPGLTHVKVLPKELCYLKLLIAILMWNGYNKADTPVD